MKKRILVIVVVIIMLVMMTVPVSAVVKPPVAVKDALLKGIWGAIMDLQKQITALTQRVDGIENSPMPEYRAGTYTTPNECFLEGYTVTFSKQMPNTNYRVSIINADPSKFYGTLTYCPDGTLTIDSRTTTGFTLSLRPPNQDSVVSCCIDYNHKFDYIAIADN